MSMSPTTSLSPHFSGSPFGTGGYISSMKTGEKAGSTSAVALPSIEGGPYWVQLRAASSNAGKVYLSMESDVTKAAGTTTVTAGMELAAGEVTPWLPLSNLSQIYIICDNAGDDVLYWIV